MVTRCYLARSRNNSDRVWAMLSGASVVVHRSELSLGEVFGQVWHVGWDGQTPLVLRIVGRGDSTKFEQVSVGRPWFGLMDRCFYVVWGGSEVGLSSGGGCEMIVGNWRGWRRR